MRRSGIASFSLSAGGVLLLGMCVVTVAPVVLADSSRVASMLSVVRTSPDGLTHRDLGVFSSEIAEDDEARQRGLSGRASLGEREAMLFVLERDWKGFFWMKGMKFPIDILFFDKDGVLVEVLPDLLPCDSECPFYVPPSGTAYVLEVRAGMALFLGLKPDDFLLLDNQRPRR